MSETFGFQSQLWQNDESSRIYSELCNAFYAREIVRLSQLTELKRLQRSLSSLPYYIERAATHIIDGNSPLNLDSQNGSWIAKQAKHCPQTQTKQLSEFYEKSAFVGLIVPVKVFEGDIITVRIDSIDEITEQRLHCNQFGWFDKQGLTAQSSHINLLKPGKATFTAACCGHRWLEHKAYSPRVLSLREMLLAARINWQNFRAPVMARRS